MDTIMFLVLAQIFYFRGKKIEQSRAKNQVTIFPFQFCRTCGCGRKRNKYNAWPSRGCRSGLYILIQLIETYFRYLGLSILLCEKNFQIAACKQEEIFNCITKLWRFFLFRASAVATNTMLGLRAAAAAANFLPYARHQLPGHTAHDFFNNVNADKDFFRLKSQLDNEINNAGNNNKFGSTTPTSESNNRPDYDVKGKNLLLWQINSFYAWYFDRRQLFS